MGYVPLFHWVTHEGPHRGATDTGANRVRDRARHRAGARQHACGPPLRPCRPHPATSRLLISARRA